MISPCYSKAGGLDLLTLDSLYDDAIRRNNQNTSYNPWEQPNSMMATGSHDPFYASNGVAAPPSVMMFQQQQQMMMMGPQQQMMNPFANPYAGPHPYGAGMPVQPYNPNPYYL